MWNCKLCSKSISSRYDLLKHLRLQHRQRQRYPCPHTNCPCTFKTWNAMHIHLSRVHPKQNSQELLELSTFRCTLCTCRSLSTEKDYFIHIGTHLKSNETVTCMFMGCSFKTNVYGTFHSHKNRKHNPHTLKNFKPGVVTTNPVSSDSPEEDAYHLDYSAVEADPVCASSDVDLNKNLPEVIEQNFAAALLKLEHFAHVPGRKLDEFLEELHYLSSSATLPLSINVLETVFQKHSTTTDIDVLTEVATALCTSNPLLKAIGKDGPLSTSYLRNQYYKKHFKVVEPIEYILDAKEKRSFQYVPVLKSLQQLFDRSDVVDRVVENHKAQQTNRQHTEQQTYKSSQDGSHFQENSFPSGDELRILITLYIDDFEICNPLVFTQVIPQILCMMFSRA
ncbi:uncharacterized protein LOC117754952 [Hippoglossus hippoglossus]|uniref:uncharacterized protein LOC117754952 n=1 Tax=Hippoglossus hippoglossus TaxID=8267 RepID=UPI00148D5AA1|nr:uncharacterized protein LOC117754952 [Hippoglossus hippoglossus]